jgi:hypothetical protein
MMSIVAASCARVYIQPWSVHVRGTSWAITGCSSPQASDVLYGEMSPLCDVEPAHDGLGGSANIGPH